MNLKRILSFTWYVGRIQIRLKLKKKQSSDPDPDVPFGVRIWFESKHSDPNSAFICNHRIVYVSKKNRKYLEIISAICIAPYPDIFCYWSDAVFLRVVDRTDYISYCSYLGMYKLIQHFLEFSVFLYWEFKF